jgi:esterase/lipase superfamily enzyme
VRTDSKTARGIAASRRSVLCGLTAAVLPATLGGCASLSAAGGRFDASDISSNPSMLVATTRNALDGARDKPWFGTERASAATIARAQLTPPDDGRFSLSSVGLGDWRLDRIELLQQADDLGQLTSGHDVLIYVHGFNQTFESAVLDAARLSDGIRFRGATMVFSWPSRAKLLDYLYDRDSAMWSRDALETMLVELTARATVGHVNIVAHSVGTMLALEALRQLYAERGDQAVEHIGAVIFASPDIDMDVFASSIRHIGPLAKKIIVITAANDRALAVSRWMAGGMTRVGSAEKSRLQQLGLRVFDASQEGWGIINHDLFLSNSQVRQLIRQVVESPEQPA